LEFSVKTSQINGETDLSGQALGLSLVRRVTSIKSQSAARITWHSHDTFEMILLKEGSTAYEFSGSVTVELRGGHFMVIPAGVLHRGVHDVRRPASLSGIMFDPRATGAITHTSFTEADLAWLESQFVQGALKSERMNTELRNLIQSLPKDFSTVNMSDVSTAATLRLTVCTILLEAAKQLANTRTFEPKQMVNAAILFMQTHLSETYSVQDVANRVHCSRTKLFQVFKDSTGLTPNDYWQRLRIDRSQTLLTETNKSITEIAMDCGFTTSQYFCNVFRKFAGVSPTDYRSSETAGSTKGRFRNCKLGIKCK
jgi:AraC-like DNA-binding protein